MFDPVYESYTLLNFTLRDFEINHKVFTHGGNFFIIDSQATYEISFEGNLLHKYSAKVPGVWHHCNSVTYNDKVYLLNEAYNLCCFDTTQQTLEEISPDIREALSR
jgi:hypothetical protein